MLVRIQFTAFILAERMGCLLIQIDVGGIIHPQHQLTTTLPPHFGLMFFGHFPVNIGILWRPRSHNNPAVAGNVGEGLGRCQTSSSCPSGNRRPGGNCPSG